MTRSLNFGYHSMALSRRLLDDLVDVHRLTDPRMPRVSYRPTLRDLSTVGEARTSIKEITMRAAARSGREPLSLKE